MTTKKNTWRTKEPHSDVKVKPHATPSIWDEKLSVVGKSPRQIVREMAGQYPDSGIAEFLKSKGFDCHTDSVTKIRQNLGLIKVGGIGGYLKVQQSPFTCYDNPPHVEGDVAVLGDVELPFHEHEFLNRVLELCQDWKITKVIFNGDLLHNHELSGWEPNWEESNTEGLPDQVIDKLMDIAAALGTKGEPLRELVNDQGRRELGNAGGLSNEWKYARESLTVMRQMFTDGATLILGNHEGRFLRNLDSALLPKDFRAMLAGEDSEINKWMAIAPYYYGILTSGGIQWRITHPKNTNVIPALIAARLSDKFGMNVIQSHNHLWGMQQAVSGRYIGVEIGCMVDGMRLPYFSQRDTTRPLWQHGAAIIRDGFCTLLHPEWTDWKRLKTA